MTSFTQIKVIRGTIESAVTISSPACHVTSLVTIHELAMLAISLKTMSQTGKHVRATPSAHSLKRSAIITGTSTLNVTEDAAARDRKATNT
ncbi:hypothetical protein PMAYCL1PPCAC_33040, partial [Pristionchus mayeri]